MNRQTANHILTFILFMVVFALGFFCGWRYVSPPPPANEFRIGPTVAIGLFDELGGEVGRFEWETEETVTIRTVPKRERPK
jgi:hypothetical protein